MNSYLVIPAAQMAARLQQHLGKDALQYHAFMISKMLDFTGRFQGGIWVLREYPNGAFALALHNPEPVAIGTGSQSTVTCSLEAASLAANLFFFSRMCALAFEAGAEEDNTYYHNLYHALRDALYGWMGFVIDRSQEDGVREPTEAERLKKVPAHPELTAIMEIID